MASQDVEAGRAYVTLYLRRVGFDQQVEQARDDTKQMEQDGQQKPGQPQQPYTEAGISMPAEVAGTVAKGAAGWLGGTLMANLARVLPLLRDHVLAPCAQLPGIKQVLTALVSGDMLPPLGGGKAPRLV
jgi:hypothetical protein